MPCRIVKIPKGKGKFRTIYVPDDETKARCLRLLPILEIRARQLDRHDVQHGFTKGRSPVTNARVHTGWQYSLSFDLKDFFDTVTQLAIESSDPGLVLQCPMSLRFMLEDGAARQGLPTSPALANIAASGMDNEIMKMQKQGRFKNFVYSRYADDMTFSFDHLDVGELLKREVPKIVQRFGFFINESKTKMQWAGAGRRVITGIAVDSQIHQTREVRRRLRAARHQFKHGIKPRNLRRLIARQKELKRKGREASLGDLLYSGFRGLKEWAKLRRPKPVAPVNQPNQQTQTPTATTTSNTETVHHAQPYKRKFA